jgi:hypothetical protein
MVDDFTFIQGNKCPHFTKTQGNMIAYFTFTQGNVSYSIDNQIV